jgi:hypothetical protein
MLLLFFAYFCGKIEKDESFCLYIDQLV